MFFRCYYHCHDCWVTRDGYVHKTQPQIDHARKMTEMNEAYVQALGYNLVSIRECEWKELKNQHGITAAMCRELHKLYFPDLR